jgi:hypothetical protein
MCFVVRGGSGCLGAASTTNYSDSSCAGVWLRLGLLFGAPSSPHRRRAPANFFYCKKIMNRRAITRAATSFPARGHLMSSSSSRDAGQLCDYWRAAASASAWLVAVGVRQELSTHQCNRWTAKRERAAFLLVSSQKGEFFWLRLSASPGASSKKP